MHSTWSTKAKRPFYQGKKGALEKANVSYFGAGTDGAFVPLGVAGAGVTGAVVGALAVPFVVGFSAGVVGATLVVVMGGVNEGAGVADSVPLEPSFWIFCCRFDGLFLL